MANYLISFIFAAAGIAVLLFNNTLSEKLGAFYSRRFTMTFGRLAHSMRWDDPTRPFIRNNAPRLAFLFAGLTTPRR